MSTSFYRATPLLLAGALLGGCTTQTPRLDQNFGMAANTLKLQQMIKPVPGDQALTRLDGPAAKAALDNYNKSFKEPKAQEGALTIGIGR